MKDTRSKIFRDTALGLVDSLDASVRLATWDDQEVKPEPLVLSAAQLVKLLGTAERLAASKFNGRPDDVAEVEAICAVMRKLDAAYRTFRKQGGGAAKGTPDLARAAETLQLEIGSAKAGADAWR